MRGRDAGDAQDLGARYVKSQLNIFVPVGKDIKIVTPAQ